MSGGGVTGDLSTTDTLAKCQTRRVHPYSADYYIECRRAEGHDGPHECDVEWNDNSPYALARLRQDSSAETHEQFIAAEQELAVTLGDYRGKWVAVRDHAVVASASTLDTLLKAIGPANDVEGVFHVSAHSTGWFFGSAAGTELRDALREIADKALRQHLDWMHFHEDAMADPFRAESMAQQFAADIHALARASVSSGADTTETGE